MGVFVESTGLGSLGGGEFVFPVGGTFGGGSGSGAQGPQGFQGSQGPVTTLTPTAIKTSNYNAAVNDLVVVDASSASVTVTLPTAPADKSEVAVKMINVSGTFATTIARGGSTDVFNKASGSTSLTLSLLNQGVILQYAASPAIWYVLSDDLPYITTEVRIDSHYGVITSDADGSSITFNLVTSDKHTVTLGGNRTLVFSGDVIGQQFTLILIQDSTGSRTVTYPSGITWSGGSAPTLQTAPGATDVVTFLKTGSGAYQGFYCTQTVSPVTQVAMVMPSALFNSSVSGSPITSAGTLQPSLATQTKNLVFASPPSGSAATPTFRTLVSGDLPGYDSFGHVIPVSNAPSATPGTGAGTGGTATIVTGGNDVVGTISVVAGTAPGTSATVATIGFSNSFASAPRAVILSPANSAAAGLSGVGAAFVASSGISNSSWTITSGTTGLTGAMTYVWYYLVVG